MRGGEWGKVEVERGRRGEFRWMTSGTDGWVDGFLKFAYRSQQCASI